MSSYVARRLAAAGIALLLVSFVAFGLGTLAPGDPAEIILLRRTGDPPTQLEVEKLRRELGLDRPFLVRYGRWLGDALSGNLGNSYRTGQPVLDEFTRRLPRTFALAALALVLGTALAVVLAVVAARRRDSWPDHAARFAAIGGASLPSYWLAYLLILLFAVAFQLLPVAGADGPRHLILPALTLAIGSAASTTRLLRASLLDELGAEYVRAARAKGGSRDSVLMRHALRNALNPVVTLSALRFGKLLGEAAIVETIFAWPGVGRFFVEAIYDRDYPAIQGGVLYLAVVFTLVNLAADFAYRQLDPRVRLGAPATERA